MASKQRGHVEQLPAEVWAQVLQQLSLQDLLRARLVSKRFVPLSNLLHLNLDWATLSEARGGSLALFIRQNCKGPTSPRVLVDILSSSQCPPMWPSIMLATECSNLRHLSCGLHFLAPNRASVCLRLLPPTLESLDLNTPFRILRDPSLQRLQCLTRLSLSGNETGNVFSETTHSAAGFQGLKSLREFAVWGDDLDEEEPSGSLTAATFSHPSLTRLQLARDPFSGELDLTGLPALRELAVFSPTDIPTWLMGHPLPRLVLDSFGQLSVCCLDKLLVQHLKILCLASDAECYVKTRQDWYIQEFLEMPRLQQLEAALDGGADASSPPLKLHGCHRKHQELLQRVCLTLHYPFQLQLSPEISVPLRKSGHAIVCICTVCVRADAWALRKGSSI